MQNVKMHRKQEVSLITESIKIQMLPCHASTIVEEMEQITEIVNRVYAEAEKGLWMHGAARTTMAEIAEFTSNGEIAVAKSMGQIIGCVRIRQLDEETGEFGMLAVDKKYQGAGIGRELIHFAEAKCQKDRLQKMQLELLVPVDGSHPVKETLKNWYTRIGYRPVYTEAMERSFPKLAQMLALSCHFIIFQKELT